MTDKTANKQRGRPFEAGQSGNPSGRPVGSRNTTTLAVESLLEGQAEQITQTAISKAIEGDGVALRLCLERIAPVRKGRPITFELPDINNSAEIAEATKALLKAVAQGEISPEEASAVAPLIEAARRAYETDELAQRIEELEKTTK